MRIRTIKPEFFTSDQIIDLPFICRLAFIGIWCAADREGRFKWQPRRLKAQILPHDEQDFAAILDTLHAAGLIRRYGNEGEYGCIPTFHQHQRPNIREQRSQIPEPDDEAQPWHNLARARLCQDTTLHVQDYAMAQPCTVQDQGEREREREKEREKEGTSTRGVQGGENFVRSPAAPVAFSQLALAYRPKSEPRMTDKLRRAWRDANPTDEEAALVAEYVTAVRKKQIPETDDLAKYCSRDIQTCLTAFGRQLTRAQEWKTRRKTDPNEAGYYAQMTTTPEGELQW